MKKFEPDALGRMVIDRDPSAIKDYTFDFTDWLGDDTISDASVTFTGGLTQQAMIKSDKMVTVWLAGGTKYKEASATCTIVTVGGRTEPQTMHFNVI